MGVEFDTPFEINAIQYQGRRNNNQYIKSYEITYSSDGENWKTYKNKYGAMVKKN